MARHSGATPRCLLATTRDHMSGRTRREGHRYTSAVNLFMCTTAGLASGRIYMESVEARGIDFRRSRAANGPRDFGRRA